MKGFTFWSRSRTEWGPGSPLWGEGPRLLGLGTCLFVIACGGINSLDDNRGPTGGGAICTSGQDCCLPNELICIGSPDEQLICTCYKSWDCVTALSTKKCTQEQADTPDGQGGWSCRVQGGREICEKSGELPPSGKAGWVCVDLGSSVECSRPTNTPDGTTDWNCIYDGLAKTCTQQEEGSPPPTGGSDWTCYEDELGNQICQKAGAGMPDGSGSWLCFWKDGSITCEGSSPAPPGGGSWSCTENGEGEWRCTRPQDSGDTPPGGGSWSCVSGSEFGGAQCTQPPDKKPGAQCVPGQQRWCDGETYCSYALQFCRKDGTWDSHCQETPDGRRPNTVCACYYFFFNEDCCETPDCILPPGSNGQICPASQGQYCDYCNPTKSECALPGALCVVGVNHETYCGQDCAGGKACPSGSKCTQTKSQGKTYYQCVPMDGSCYE